MSDPVRGKYRVRYAETPADLRKAQDLRRAVFRAGGQKDDADGFDARALHLLVEAGADGALAGCCRLLRLTDGSQIGGSYAAQYYDLDALGQFPAPMLELGRFCVAPEARGVEVPRLLWAALTAHVEENGIELVFGCTSFSGTEAARYDATFALLTERHLAPRHWRPAVKAPAVVRFARGPRAAVPDPRPALRAMPPLLRSYLAMGGWVSDHAVIDSDLDTMHVFTGMEMGAVSRARLARMRGLAAS